jgi:hypothetical protein
VPQFITDQSIWFPFGFEAGVYVRLGQNTYLVTENAGQYLIIRTF